MFRRLLVLVGAVSTLSPDAAFAWCYEGHEIIADIARPYLTPEAKAKVDALLAADADTSPPPTWRRVRLGRTYRSAGHRETASWHFVDVELGNPDLDAACFGFPP